MVRSKGESARDQSVGGHPVQLLRSCNLHVICIPSSGGLAHSSPIAGLSDSVSFLLARSSAKSTIGWEYGQHPQIHRRSNFASRTLQGDQTRLSEKRAGDKGTPTRTDIILYNKTVLTDACCAWIFMCEGTFPPSAHVLPLMLLHANI